jgi:hypothetical protein
MVLLLILVTWFLIFIATREIIPFKKRRFFFIGAILVSSIAMAISINQIIENFTK